VPSIRDSGTPFPTGNGAKALFLDRDGVLAEDIHLLTRACDLKLMRGVPDALRGMKAAGFRLIVVSNQPVVARGLCTEDDVVAVNQSLAGMIEAAGGPRLDGLYFCPHHPRAAVERYRVVCECRKPGPGMLLRAAAEHDVSLAQSYMIGDRMSDIVAGSRAGTRNILVETGMHLEPAIVSGEPLPAVEPDFRCAGLPEAVRWILDHK
jgi:D-glycero-D-manno-heptose 1,7-bisphosphate phosphatase